jgi:hypothetical protein
MTNGQQAMGQLRGDGSDSLRVFGSLPTPAMTGREEVHTRRPLPAPRPSPGRASHLSYENW